MGNENFQNSLRGPPKTLIGDPIKYINYIYISYYVEIHVTPSYLII